MVNCEEEEAVAGVPQEPCFSFPLPLLLSWVVLPAPVCWGSGAPGLRGLQPGWAEGLGLLGPALQGALLLPAASGQEAHEVI